MVTHPSKQLWPHVRRILEAVRTIVQETGSDKQAIAALAGALGYLLHECEQGQGRDDLSKEEREAIHRILGDLIHHHGMRPISEVLGTMAVAFADERPIANA